MSRAYPARRSTRSAKRRRTESIVARRTESSAALRAWASRSRPAARANRPAATMRRVAESPLTAAPHTLPVPCVTRCAVSTSTVVTRDGLHRGRRRYVRVHTSVVLSSDTTVPMRDAARKGSAQAGRVDQRARLERAHASARRAARACRRPSRAARRMRIHDAERGAVGRHGARAEIRIRVEDRDAHRRVGGL